MIKKYTHMKSDTFLLYQYDSQIALNKRKIFGGTYDDRSIN